MNPLTRFWHYLQTLGAPAAAPVISLAPIAPMAQDEFPSLEAQAPAVKRQEIGQHALYMRIIAANNAYVTRDYGAGPVEEHTDTSVAVLSAEELAELARGADPLRVRYIDPVADSIARSTHLEPASEADLT